MAESKDGDPKIDFDLLVRVAKLISDLENKDIIRNLDHMTGQFLVDLHYTAGKVGNRLITQKTGQSSTSREVHPAPYFVNDDLFNYLLKDDFEAFFEEVAAIKKRDKG